MFFDCVINPPDGVSKENFLLLYAWADGNSLQEFLFLQTTIIYSSKSNDHFLKTPELIGRLGKKGLLFFSLKLRNV